MGKYINKASVTPDVALMDLANQSIGVRTRAKTLALRRLQSDSGYLQLRSRRLQKSPLYFKTKNPNPAHKQKQGGAVENPGPEKAPTGSGVNTIDNGEPKLETGGEEIEPGLGENDLAAAAQPRGRSTRESTPCNMIISADNVKSPASTTKRRSPTVANQSNHSVSQNDSTTARTAREMEEFLARVDREDKLDQQRFMDKYNFDVVNDKPLPEGRYEWEPVAP